MNRVINSETMGDISDREPVARCQESREAAFDTLVLRHRERAFNIAYSRLVDQEDATEAAQDAFVKAYTGIA